MTAYKWACLIRWNTTPPEEYMQFFVRRLKSSVAIGGLSNDDGDVNENVKKVIGFSSLAKQ